jgi:hypothetical protein
MTTETMAQETEQPVQPEMVWVFFPLENNSLGVIGLPAKDFNPQQFYGCMAWYLTASGVASFAMGPAGPGFFFAASFAAAANCGYNAYNNK